MTTINSINNNISKTSMNNPVLENTVQQTSIPNQKDSFEKTKTKKKNSIISKIFGLGLLGGLSALIAIAVKRKVNVTKNLECLSKKLQEPTNKDFNLFIKDFNNITKLKLTNELLNHNGIEKAKPEDIRNIINKVSKEKNITFKPKNNVWYDIFDFLNII